VVRIGSNETISEAFKKMMTFQILAIPVVQPVTSKPLYLIRLMTIVASLLHHYPAGTFPATVINSIKNIFGTNKTEEFMNTKLSDVEDEANFRLDPVFIVKENATLLEAVRVIVTNLAHRVVVVNDQGDLVNVITQSRLIQFISNIVDSIPKCKKSLTELKMDNKSLVCVLENQTAYEAFRIMKERNMTGLAVINSNGALLGNISISDLKLISYRPSYWSFLSKTVVEYLQAIRSNPDTKIRSHVFALLEDSSSKYPLVLKCRPHHSLGFVIRMLAYYRVHRLYVVDDLGIPSGVITLTDILKELLQY